MEQAAEMVPGLDAPGAMMPRQVASAHGGLARVHLNAGDKAGARRELTSFENAHRRLHGTEVFWRLIAVAAIDECLPALGGDALVETIYREIASYRTFRCAWLDARGFDRIRGSLALRLDLIDEAEQHYRAGLEWSERERCPVEQGRCLQGLAEITERRGDQRDATRYLDRAAALFQEHGAQL